MAQNEPIKSPIQITPKVVVALAVQDTIKTKTALSLICALREGDYDYDIAVSMGCDLIGSRTRLVRQAQAMGASHMLYLDHDMFLEPVKTDDGLIDPITLLLDADKEVIGAPYNFRSLPPKSTAIPMDKTSDTEPYKVKALGTGFLLIRMDVFDRIEKPWFQFGRDENAELIFGEDTWFVSQCIKAGIDVWAHPKANIGHLGEFSY